MAVNVSTLVPASLKAKAVATEEYVDNEVGNVSVSYGNMTGKDSLAQELGYLNYAALQAASAGGTTIINGGNINTGLIEANAITANMLAASGIITNTAQISNGVITNANIANATIDGAKIANATIGTAQIGSAAIKEAQVDSLAIKTGHLQYQAVTIPISSYVSGSILCGTTWTTVASIINFASLGNPIDVTGQASVVGGSGSYNDANANHPFEFRLLYGGSVVIQGITGSYSETAGQEPCRGPAPVAYRHTPGVGNHSYYLQVRSQSNSLKATATYRYMRVAEVQR